jgi:uncharacterized protein
VSARPSVAQSNLLFRVVGGTCWLWASENATQQLDYLFVDEAGQLSLAMMLAAGRAARNIVLLGDPQQLEQAFDFPLA